MSRVKEEERGSLEKEREKRYVCVWVLIGQKRERYFNWPKKEKKTKTKI